MEKKMIAFLVAATAAAATAAASFWIRRKKTPPPVSTLSPEQMEIEKMEEMEQMEMVCSERLANYNQVYRLHQLNRAAQLVTALSFSVRGAETTSQTINSSLGTLMMVLQILGVICFWSLSSFLMRSLPSSQVIFE